MNFIEFAILEFIRRSPRIGKKSLAMSVHSRVSRSMDIDYRQVLVCIDNLNATRQIFEFAPFRGFEITAFGEESLQKYKNMYHICYI